MDSDDIKRMLVDAIRKQGDGKERSLQTAIGPSEIGGCRRKTWLKLQGQAVVNRDTKMLAAWMGTALHTEIEAAMLNFDPFDTSHREIEVERDGIKGHVDYFDPASGTIVDWKSTTKKNLRYFPSEQQRWQVQVYGWLLSGNGYEVQNVALAAICRDGTEDDIKVHCEAYSEDVALEALSWLEGVKRSTDAPAPEKSGTFCSSYCPFFTEDGSVCAGK